MKKLSVLLAALLLLSLWGCVEEPAADPTGTSQLQAQTQTTFPSAEQPATTEAAQTPTHPLPTTPDAGDSISVGTTGAVRVSYSIPVSNVRYITSADQLPENEAFAAYDETYFETAALLLVTESVTSAAIRVEIQSISLEEGVARVTLLHEPQGDMGIPVMTAWMLWAEVELGLDVQWVVENPAMESEVNRE